MKAIVLLLSLLSVSVVYADPPPNYPFQSYDAGLRAAAQSHKPIFLYFGRLGCGWCDKVNKEVFVQSAMRERYMKDFELVYADSESGKHLTLPSGERITEMELGARLKVLATPVFAYLEPNGKLIFKIAGYQNLDDFMKYDRFVAGGHYRTQDIREFIRNQP